MDYVSIIDQNKVRNPAGLNSTNIESIRKTVPINRTSNEDFAIYLTTIIVLALFFFWLAYAIIYDLYTRNVTSSTAVNQCLPGQCVMDQNTGEKYCPSPGGRFAYNITTQECMYPGICQGNLPYGINSDNGSSVNGICQNDPLTGLPLNCRCGKKLTCPDYLLTSFTTITGNPFSNSTNTQFAQNLISAYGGSGEAIVPPNSGFCTIPLNWLLRSTPGCAGVTGSNNYEIAKHCLMKSPCLQGVAAFISENANTVGLSDLDSTSVGCVRADYADKTDQDRGECDIANGFIPVFDRLTNKVMCRLICQAGYEARYEPVIPDGYVTPPNYGCYPNCTLDNSGPLCQP